MGSKKRIFTVLVIDGGGVRGIIPAKALQELEERTGKPVHELFDLVALTSTGSLIGSSLTVPSKDDDTKSIYTAKEVVESYKKEASNIFPDIKFRNLKHFVPGTDGYYDVKNFENILDNTFGDDKIEDCMTNIIISSVDVKYNRPVLINKLQNVSDKEGWGKMKFSDAIRASCTAPSLFHTKYFYTEPSPDSFDAKERYVLVDGSIFGSTMPRHAYTKAKEIAPPDSEIVMVHLGTLFNDYNISPEEFNSMSPIGLLKETVGMIMQMTLAATLKDLDSEMGDRLFSFDGAFDKYEPDIVLQTRIDDASDDNIDNIIKYADKLIEDHSDFFDKLCEVLVNKTYVDKKHDKSNLAMRALIDELIQTKNIKQLNIVYRDIVEYCTDIEQNDLNEDSQRLYDLAKQLNDPDQAKLERVFKVMQDKRTYQSKFPQKIKRGLSAIFKPFSKKQKKKPSNDNKSCTKQKKSNKNDPKM